MADYRSNKTCKEIDAILDNAVLQGSAEDTADDNTMAGLRKYVAEQSASSLIMAGTITSAFTILDGVTVGAVVLITREFAQKYKVDTITKRRFVIVDKRVAGEEGDTLYIYPEEYPGCYFVMGAFDGNNDIFGLGASTNDWIISQGRVWVKIATTQRNIAGIKGDVTAEALVKRLSTQSSDNANPVATKSDIKEMVKGVTVNNATYYPDAKGNVSLPAILTKNDIANMGFTTGVMVNGETKSPNSAGVVDLGDIKVDEVKFANDLTGVIEATPEIFTYRPSAGDKSVRDESAVIRRIKGNTSVWGQFADKKIPLTNTNYILTHNDDGSITIKRDPTITSGYWCALNMEKAYRHTSHKYMFTADVSVNGVQSTADYCSVSIYNLAVMEGNHKNYRTNGRYFFCCFGTAGTSTSWQFAFYIYGVAEMTIHNLQCFDLTNLFCAGNEPTTYEEFRKYYPDAYYPYCAPEVRSMRATGIETIGFNAFNGEYAEVIGGLTYYLGGVIESVTFATEKNGERTEIIISENRLYTPPTNGYIYATGSDICINLSHSGVRNGEYKPYEKSTLLLPEIAKYFPNGMHGIGDVFDEINEDMAVKRFGVVDLGTLTWGTISTNTSDVFRWQSVEQINRPTQATNIFPNIVCLKYATGTNDNTYAKVDCISIGSSGNIRIFDSNYTTRDDKDAFVASLQGVLLYYELAEPIYTPIDEPLQLDYKVADFGTERMLSNAPSAPFKADIVYQFNAEGRIRDNSRNIEKLEELVKQPSDWLEENPSSPTYIKNKPTMPTQVATATEVIVEYGIPTQMLPNVVYELATSIENFTFPQLVPGEENVRNVWKLIAYMAPETVISYPSTIRWRDGIPPTIDAAAFVELTFTSMTMQNAILGEWKLYK